MSTCKMSTRNPFLDVDGGPVKYEQVNSGQDGNKSTKTNYGSWWKVVVYVLVTCLLFIVGVIIGYKLSNNDCSCGTVTEGRDSDIAKQQFLVGPRTFATVSIWDEPEKLHLLHNNLIAEISEDILNKDNSDYGSTQIYTSSRADEDLLQELYVKLQKQAFDKVEVLTHEADLSLPDDPKPNIVQIIDNKNQTIYDASIEPDISPENTEKDAITTSQNVTADDFLQPYVANSPSGKVEAELTYLNYGRQQDVADAINLYDIVVQGKVALVRLGKITLEQKLEVASRHGISALLVYWDPQDLPYKTNCTRITPYAALRNNSPAKKRADAINGTTLVQTISCETANVIISHLTGQKAPILWKTKFNLARYIGSTETQGWRVRIEVNNKKEKRKFSNLIATLVGRHYADQYVLVGAGRTSFQTGRQGAFPGTNILMDYASRLSSAVLQEPPESWTPKRTIKLCFWAGTEFGQLGITHFLQEFKEVLDGKVMAYIDLDDVFLGNRSLHVTASPALHHIVNQVTSKVESPSDQSQTVYESWLQSSNSGWDIKPTISIPSADQFATQLGVPVVHMQYIGKLSNAKWLFSNLQVPLPVPDAGHVMTIGRLSGLLMLQLADADLIPYNMHASVHELSHRINKVVAFCKTLMTNNSKDDMLTMPQRVDGELRALRNYVKYYMSNINLSVLTRINQRFLYFETQTKHLLPYADQLCSQCSDVIKARRRDDSSSTDRDLTSNKIHSFLHRLRSVTYVIQLDV